MLRRYASGVVVAVSVLVTVVVWVVAFRTAAGARLDSAVLDGFTRFDGSRLRPLAAFAVGLADPLPFAAMALAIVVIAIARRRPRDVVVVGVVLFAANVTTQLLKPLATIPRPADAPPGAPLVDAWPSGHMTAALSVALCLVLVVPGRLRPSAAAAGGLFAVAEGYGLLVLGWHYPSDVVAACGVAMGWLALGVAAGRVEGEGTAGARNPDARPVFWPAAGATLLVVALAAGAVLARPARAFAFVQENTTFVAAAVVLGIAALGLVALTAAALTVIERGARRPPTPSAVPPQGT